MHMEIFLVEKDKITMSIVVEIMDGEYYASIVYKKGRGKKPDNIEYDEEILPSIGVEALSRESVNAPLSQDLKSLILAILSYASEQDDWYTSVFEDVQQEFFS